MLVCIPTNGDAGSDDTLCDHFGSAPFFAVYDSVSDHAHGACHPLSQLAGHHIDSIVCSAIGRRAIEMLNSEGIKVYCSDKKYVRDVIEQIKNNNLPEMDPATACKGHGQKTGVNQKSPPEERCGCGKEHETGMHQPGKRNCCQENDFGNKNKQK